MKAATVKDLKDELAGYSQKEILVICLRLSKFKKENKELLTYLLFESKNEMAYIENVKNEVDIQFEQINKSSNYYIKKSVRKILRTIKKYIRYSQNKETEVELLIYFCDKLNSFHPSINKSNILQKLYLQQIENIRRTVSKLHEDLQYDYEKELDELSLK